MGLLSKLFAKGVAKNLSKNTDIEKAVSKTERELANSRDEIEKAAGDKETVKKALSPAVRKALGFDY